MKAEDFKQLTKDVKDYEKKAMEGYEKAYSTSLVSLNERKNSGDLSKKQYNIELKKLQAGYYKQQQNTLSKGSDYVMGTIKATYPELAKSMKKMQKEVAKGLKESLKNGVSAKDSENILMSIVDNARSKASLNSSDASALKQIMKDSGIESMFDEIDDLQSRINNLDGIDLTKNFEKTLTNKSLFKGVNEKLDDSVDSVYEALGQDIQSSSEASVVYQAAYEMGGRMPESIAKGFKANEPIARQAVKDMINSLGGLYSAQGYTANITGSTASDFINNSKNKITYNTPIGPTQQKKSSSGGNSKKTTVKGKKNAKGGIYNNPIISLLAEKDSEAVIPLNNSPRSKALYQRTGELLGMSFTDDNTSYKQSRDVRLYNAVKRSPSIGGEKINITYSPTIQVTGNADEKTLTKVVKMSQAEFAKMMQKYMQSNKRVKFS